MSLENLKDSGKPKPKFRYKQKVNWLHLSLDEKSFLLKVSIIGRRWRSFISAADDGYYYDIKNDANQYWHGVSECTLFKKLDDALLFAEDWYICSIQNEINSHKKMVASLLRSSHHIVNLIKNKIKD